MTVSSIFITAMMLFLSTNAFATPRKVVLVIFENTAYDEALSQPFFAKFAKGGVLLTDYHAIGHPSQPNYLALVAGSDMGSHNDSNIDLDGQNLADLVESKGRSWHVYAEKFPSPCFLGTQKKGYVRKHNPLLSFTNIQNNPARCAHITDATSFSDDFKNAKLADFTMYIPDVRNDGHDTDAAFADNWFTQTFDPLMQDQKAMDGVLLIAIFDEDDGSDGNHIFAALSGPDVVPGTVLSTRYDHYNLLRTIENVLQLGNMGRQDASAPLITGFLK